MQVHVGWFPNTQEIDVNFWKDEQRTLIVLYFKESFQSIDDGNVYQQRTKRIVKNGLSTFLHYSFNARSDHLSA